MDKNRKNMLKFSNRFLFMYPFITDVNTLLCVCAIFLPEKTPPRRECLPVLVKRAFAGTVGISRQDVGHV